MTKTEQSMEGWKPRQVLPPVKEGFHRIFSHKPVLNKDGSIKTERYNSDIQFNATLVCDFYIDLPTPEDS